MIAHRTDFRRISTVASVFVALRTRTKPVPRGLGRDQIGIRNRDRAMKVGRWTRKPSSR